MDRGIDRVSLGIAAYDGVVRVDIRKETLALENGLYVSFSLATLMLSSMYSLMRG